ncbi:Rho GTPase activation protein [Gongronella butleri]|nr:Rho GTPase activation protein [Gongronella butleri]
MGDQYSDTYSRSSASFVSYTDVDQLQQFSESTISDTTQSIDAACTPDQLRQMLITERARSKEMEIKLDKYKVLMDQEAGKASRLVEQVKQQLGLDMHDTNGSQLELEHTCERLRCERDQLIQDIEAKALPVLSQALQTQLASLHKDIDDAKMSLDQVNSARDHVLEEMILLNTKNAELNEMNNNLSRHIAQRERETRAFMASTQFLRPSRSTDTTSTSTSSLLNSNNHNGNNGNNNSKGELASSSSAISTAHSTPAPSIQRSSSSSSSSHSRHQRSRSSGESSSSKIFNFQRSRNVLASINPLSKKKSIEISKPDPNAIQIITTLGPPALPPHTSPQSPSSTSSSSAASYSTHNPAATHPFVEAKFTVPEQCAACHDKIWRATELKCPACSLPCHTRCIPQLEQPCRSSSMNSNSLPRSSVSGSVFARDIADQAQLEHHLVPNIVQSCVEAVDQRGLDWEGVYRKSGRATETRAIQQALDQGQALNLLDEEQWPDIHAIASVLKSYFRTIPSPLFPFEHYDALLQAAEDEDSEHSVSDMRRVLSLIPKENYATMQFLLEHLDRVQQHSDTNLMVIKNIAMIFGPTLIRHPDEHTDMMDTNRKIYVLYFMLRHLSAIFA